MNICDELLCYFIFRVITSTANVGRYFIYFVMHLAQIILFCVDIISTSEPGIVCVCNKYIFFLLADIMPLCDHVRYLLLEV